MMKSRLLPLLLGAVLVSGCTIASKNVPAVQTTSKAEPKPAPKQTLEAALQERLKGPTAEETAAGKHVWFSAETAGMLKSVTVNEKGRAIVDFADFRAKMSGASTSAGSAELIAELSSTVFKFPEVQEVEYRFEGSCDAFWEWLQRACTVVPASQYR